MQRNMANFDRIIRAIIAVGIVLMYASEIITGSAGLGLMLVALVFLATSFSAFCPLYYLLGISSCARKGKKSNYY